MAGISVDLINPFLMANNYNEKYMSDGYEYR